MKNAYIDYAMSVIVARALPDVRDGLKPVQRRILYAMFKEGIMPGSKYSKCAGVVGEVLKKYHPHGDSSVYDALARMVQEWTLRYPLIDGQGNFGSIDGDSPAAYRYTECRLEKISTRLLDKIEKDTVDFVPNFTGEEVEPTVLPTLVPNLLINGTDGIAVGMATKIAPHNLGEIVDGLVAMIDEGNKYDTNVFSYSQYAAKDYYEAVDYDISSKGIVYPEFLTSLTIDELMKHVKGPDFPTGAEIYNSKDIQQAYETGRGRVLMRAVASIEEANKGKMQIIITELPYQMNKARLAEKIYDLFKDGKIEGISDIRDESTNKEGIRLVVELRRGVVPNVVLNKLYKYTEMQSAFNFNTVALVDGEPRVLSLRQILEQFIRHRYQVIIRASIYDLNKNIAHIHILEGLLKALDIIDEIIQLIRSSRNADIAKQGLIEQYGFTDVQAQAILDMQLRKLAALEREKLQEEYDKVKALIDELTARLDSQEKIEGLIKDSLLDVKEKFGDKRRTRVNKGMPGEFNEEDLVEKENIIVSISHQGYIKRMKASEFRSQTRGGKGSIGSSTKEGDYINHLIYCNTHSEVLLFSNKGKVYSLRAYEIPEYARKAKGLPLVNLVSVEQGEIVTSVLARSVENGGGILDAEETQEGEELVEDGGRNYKFLFMATKKGTVKKVGIDQFEGIRKNGLIAISLDPGDELLYVRPTYGDSDVLMMTENAKTVRFDESKVSATGRTSRGVRGIRLEGDDNVIMMDVVRNTEDRVLVVSEKGFGKITPLSDFPQKGRGTKGMFGYKITSKTGKIAAARILDHPKKEILLMSEKGQSIRTPLENIRVAGRVTSGVIIFRMPGDDQIAVMTVF
ncbi:MAG: DNA gyrase subunit A [Candidatus Dojkabacteria bacterium]